MPDESVVPSAHYGQLIAAAESDVVTEAYQKGRVSLDAAISEGYDVRKFASDILRDAVEVYITASAA